MMHIGVLGALPDEVDALTELLEGPQEIHRSGRRFVQGRCGDRTVTLAHAHVGKVAAAITAMTMVEHFEVDGLVFTGLAGSLRDELHPGDVVVASGLIQHDLDARPLFPRFEVPLTGHAVFGVDEPWSEALAQRARVFQAERGAALPTEVLEDLPREGQVLRGLVATGDEFVTATGRRQAIEEAVPDALCVEMEGASVAQVAQATGVPVAVVRVISDRADGGAADHLLAALGGFAGAYAVGIVGSWLRG